MRQHAAERHSSANSHASSRALDTSTSATFVAIGGLVCLVCTLTLFSASASAQIPDTFKNLQLLDEDISKDRIVGIMRDWAGGLGVRCSHCHVTPDNLVGADFASDEKATKRTARRMLEMSRRLNRELLEDLPVVEEDGRSRHQIVSCYTCHRGLPTPPRNLRVQLGRTFAASGVDGAMAELQQLRTEHFGSGRYDFSGRNLAAMGRTLLDANRSEDAVKWLTMALELEPESAYLHATLALARLETGERDLARQALEKAQELDPENPTARFVARQIERQP